MTEKAQTSPHWDLSNVYPSLESEGFLEAVADLKAQLDDLAGYLANHHIGRLAPEAAVPDDADQLTPTVSGYLDRLNAIMRLYRTLQAYVSSFVTTDSYNNLAKRRLSELEMLGARRRQLEVRFQGWLGSIASALPQILQRPGPPQEHAFFLQEVVEQSQYLMGEAEESLAQELMLSGAAAWRKLQGTVCSQLNVEFQAKDQVERLPITALQNLRRSHPDGELRRRAYQVELAAWESVKEPLAAALNGVKGTVATLNQHRGRADALHQPIDQSRIDRETLETMLGGRVIQGRRLPALVRRDRHRLSDVDRSRCGVDRSRCGVDRSRCGVDRRRRPGLLLGTERLERQVVGIERPLLGLDGPRRARVSRGSVELGQRDVLLLVHRPRGAV